MHPDRRPNNRPPGASRQPRHSSTKQEKALAAVCIAVAAIMLLSLSRYMFH
ncbi:hypothetical protein [Gordoniibacillus kamchatkensis]|uniref:hypothetical protein n=1 Tax=Gordoniibacillus kamchatkensis TaxID=1590651 RepID=UPI0012E00A57|nr:hypothetical protein [Paenibacillus sp. VKM B-2647]